MARLTGIDAPTQTTPKVVQFASGADRALILRIVARYFRWAQDKRISVNFTRQDLAMDVSATHANGNPLRLRELLAADDFNFLHDVGGIVRHIDRNTGTLLNHFRPRFTVRT